MHLNELIKQKKSVDKAVEESGWVEYVWVFEMCISQINASLGTF